MSPPLRCISTARCVARARLLRAKRSKCLVPSEGRPSARFSGLMDPTYVMVWTAHVSVDGLRRLYMPGQRRSVRSRTILEASPSRIEAQMLRSHSPSVGQPCIVRSKSVAAAASARAGAGA